MNHINIRNALHDILSDLTLARPITIGLNLPETAFSQKHLPLVVLDQPVLEDMTNWDNLYQREVYSATIRCIDAYRNAPDGVDAAVQYIQWLRLKVVQKLQASNHMNLQHLHCHNSFVTYDFQNEVEEFEGLNLVMLSVNLSIPVIVLKTSTWTFSDGIGTSGESLDYNNLITED